MYIHVGVGRVGTRVLEIQWFPLEPLDHGPVVFREFEVVQWFLGLVVCFLVQWFLVGRRPTPLSIPVVIDRPKADVLLIPVVQISFIQFYNYVIQL